MALYKTRALYILRTCRHSTQNKEGVRASCCLQPELHVMELLLLLRETGLRIFIIWASYSHFPRAIPTVLYAPVSLNLQFPERLLLMMPQVFKHTVSPAECNLLCSLCHTSDAVSTIKPTSFTSLSRPTPTVIPAACPFAHFPLESSAANLCQTHHQPEMHVNLFKLSVMDLVDGKLLGLIPLPFPLSHMHTTRSSEHLRISHS